MSLNLADLHTARFAPDGETDELNGRFMSYLGMPNRYQPARLAIARSLAVSQQPPLVTRKTSKTIHCDTLFGSPEVRAIWIAAIVQHADDAKIDNAKLADLVSAHWRRGLKLLDDEWRKSDQNFAQFVRRLIDVAGLPSTVLPTTNGGTSAGAGVDTTGSAGKISVPIGEVSKDTTTQEEIIWDLNARAGSPHSAIMGGVGSGKTRTAVAMLTNIHEQAPNVPLVAFDFKGDLGGGDNTYKIDQLFGARIVSPPRESVPLDVLSLYSQDQVGVANAAYRFRDAFSNLKGTRLGDRQRDAVYEAAQRALVQSPCELQSVLDCLIDVYEEKEMKKDGAISAMNELCRFPLFKPELDPASFFQQSWLIHLPQDMPEDNRIIVVNLVLNALDSYLNSLDDTDVDADGSRSLRILCMVDEAHQILRGKLPSLSNLIRMSRSKGGAIMLISQSPDDFSGEKDEFLDEMGLVVAFSTNASSRNANRILGKNANLAALSSFQCLVKRRGDQASKKVQAF